MRNALAKNQNLIFCEGERVRGTTSLATHLPVQVLFYKICSGLRGSTHLSAFFPRLRCVFSFNVYSPILQDSKFLTIFTTQRYYATINNRTVNINN